MTMFSAARPVWPRGMERDMNRFVRFRASLPPFSRAVLRITASTCYRAWLDNQFVGTGPARAAHGYFRVDEWPLQRSADAAAAQLLIEVAGYNVNSYYTLDQPAFLLAEVIDDGGRVVAATGGGAFEAFLAPDRVREVERYSAARTFSEVFCLDSRVPQGPVPQCEQPAVKLLARGLPYPDFAVAADWRTVADGTIEPFQPAELRRDWTLTCIGPDFKGFGEDQLQIIPSLELQKLRTIAASTPAGESFPVTLPAGRFRIVDLGKNLTGYIRFTVRCDAACRLALAFDEILSAGDVCFNRFRCNNVLWVDAAAGTWAIESFEPYTLRYVKLMCLEGSCSVDALSLRRLEHPPIAVSLNTSDERLRTIFDAAVSTFRQNAVDLPTDCPSRERAGWLCDSFYIARAAHRLTGTTALERNFLENYLLPDRFDHLPDGIVAMNYPADHYNGKFIPNWALWLVLQLEEYLSRSGDRAMIDAFGPRVAGILRYFDKFRNPDGLLERLESWVFVEWSAANDFVQDVNYPTNMLYAAALDSAARMYRRTDWAQHARQIREVVAVQSFDGEFFVDNALRTDGTLRPTRNRTEVCQYHAFLFGVASQQSHPQLWRRVLDRNLGDLHPANALMGYTMRLELLDRHAGSKQICDELIEMYLDMARTTGTLWEHNQPTESCCHGYASFAAVLLLKHAPLATRQGGE